MNILGYRDTRRVRDGCYGAAVLCLTLLVGCQTLPQELEAPAGISVNDSEQVLVPTISGTVLRSGEAAAGVELLLARNQGSKATCEPPLATTITDEQGRFEFEQISGKLFTSRTLRLQNNWQVCLTEDGSARTVWYDQHTGILFSDEKAANLLCEIDAATRKASGNRGALACQSTAPPEDETIQLDSVN